MLTKAQKRLARTCWKRINPHLRDPLVMREATAALIREKQTERGTVWVYTWARDCDGMEADQVDEIPANIIAFERFLDGFAASAEGPQTCDLMTEAEAQNFEPHRRDLFAELAGY
jgi:hypothetical protein